MSKAVFLAALFGSNISYATDYNVLAGVFNAPENSATLIVDSGVTASCSSCNGLGDDVVIYTDSKTNLSIRNDGTITSDEYGIVNNSTSSIDLLTNNDEITTTKDSIVNEASAQITLLKNNGDIESSDTSGIWNKINGTIDEIVNAKDATIKSTYESAIYNEGLIKEVNNSGELTANTSDVGAIYNDGTINEINNSGSINIAAGAEYSAIYNDGNGVIDLINNESGGTITGDSSIENYNEIDVIENSGNFTATVGSGYGAIYNYNGTINTINNNSGGYIVGDIGIQNLGSNSSISTINNSGTIEGRNGTAIYYNGSANNTLNLNSGSRIIGKIDYTDGSNSAAGNVINVNSSTQSAIYYYDVSDQSHLSVNESGGALISRNESDETISVTSATDATALNSVVNVAKQTSSDVENLIINRLKIARFEDSNKKYATTPILVSSSDSNLSHLGIKFDDSQTYFWAEAFGSHQKKNSYKTTKESESQNAGIIIGFNKELEGNNRIGGFIGGLDSKTEVGVNGDSPLIKNRGIFAGTYASFNNHKPYFTDLSLIVGLVENNMDRLVINGSTNETASSNYNTIFFTPSITFGKELKSLPLIASANLRYTGQFIEGYEETGSSSNLNIDERYLNTISTRLKLETTNQAKRVNDDDYFNVNFRGGVEANRSIGNQNVDIKSSGSNINFAPDYRKYNVDIFIGLNAKYDVNNNVQFYTDLELTKGLSKNLSNNSRGIYGKLGLKYAF